MRNPAAEAILYSALWQAGVTRACQSDQYHRGDRIQMPLLTSRTGQCQSDGSLPMNETCDRCGPAVRATYRVHKRSELYLCRHCAARLWPALSAQDWTIGPINAYSSAPQAEGYADAGARE
jgi:hypothetical protein